MLASLHFYINSSTTLSTSSPNISLAALKNAKYISKANFIVGRKLSSLVKHLQSSNRWQNPIKSFISLREYSFWTVKKVDNKDIKNYDLNKSFYWLMRSKNQLYWNIYNTIIDLVFYLLNLLGFRFFDFNSWLKFILYWFRPEFLSFFLLYYWLRTLFTPIIFLHASR